MLYGLLSTPFPFTPEKDIPDLTGKVILITGGNSGLGYQTLLTLAPHNPTRIYLCARSPSSASAAISSVESRVPQIAGRITFLQLDLADLDSVVSCARGFLDCERKREGGGKERLDLLMLNAGIMAVPEGVTRQGYEVQFGTNHLGHFLLAKLLLPTLLSTAQSPSLAGSASDVRIVVLSSIGHFLAPLRSGIDFTSLKTDCGGWFSLVRYGQSKLANLLFVKELERRYGKTGITSVAVHPGLIDTNLDASCRKWPYGLGTLLNLVRPVFYRSVEEGVKNQLWAAFGKRAGEGKGTGEVKSGEYYTPVGISGQWGGWAGDADLARRLWEWSEKEIENYKL